MRTRQRICKTKKSYPDHATAAAVAAHFDHAVRPYRCDRCHAWHLTSRLKGKRIPRPDRNVPPDRSVPNTPD
jgi:hypothetical protein